MGTGTATSSPSRYRKLSAYLGLAIVLLAAVLSVGIALRSRARAIDDEATVWRPAQVAARQLLTAVIDQETGHRSFVATGDEDFLVSYETGRAQAAAVSDQLRALFVGRQGVIDVLEAAESSLVTWQKEVVEPRIYAARAGGVDGPDDMTEGDGNLRLNTFRADHANLVDAIDEGFRRSEHRRNRAFTVLLVTVVAGLIVLAAVVGVLHRSQAWLAERERLLRAEQGLRIENAAAAEDLERAAALLGSVIGAAPVGVAVYDPQLRFMHVNEALASLHGREVGDYIGLTPAEIFPSDVATSVESRVRRAMAGEPLIDEHLDDLDVGANDRRLNLLVSHFPIRTGSGRLLGVGCTVVDVTEQTRTAMSLNETTALLDREIVKVRAVEQRVRRIAETLQESLLPKTIPAIEGLEFAVRYRPAGADMDVGGDFYDVAARPDGTVAVSIGDVCGHDVEAAVLTGLVRHVMGAAAQHLRDPADVLRWANQAVLGNTDNDRFVSAAHAHLEPAHDEQPALVRLTLAGHPHPILIPADGSPAVEIGRSGTLLGLSDQARFATVGVEMAPGDQIVFYTDGLLENSSPRVTTDELVTLLDRLPRQTAEHTAAGVLDLYDKLNTRASLDDVALLVVRRQPLSVEGPAEHADGPSRSVESDAANDESPGVDARLHQANGSGERAGAVESIQREDALR